MAPSEALTYSQLGIKQGKIIAIQPGATSKSTLSLSWTWGSLSLEFWDRKPSWGGNSQGAKCKEPEADPSLKTVGSRQNHHQNGKSSLPWFQTTLQRHSWDTASLGFHTKCLCQTPKIPFPHVLVLLPCLKSLCNRPGNRFLKNALGFIDLKI